jgi:hypothetical protein
MVIHLALYGARPVIETGPICLFGESPKEIELGKEQRLPPSEENRFLVISSTERKLPFSFRVSYSFDHEGRSVIFSPGQANRIDSILCRQQQRQERSKRRGDVLFQNETSSLQFWRENELHQSPTFAVPDDCPQEWWKTSQSSRAPMNIPTQLTQKSHALYCTYRYYPSIYRIAVVW